MDFYTTGVLLWADNLLLARQLLQHLLTQLSTSVLLGGGCQQQLIQVSLPCKKITLMNSGT